MTKTNATPRRWFRAWRGAVRSAQVDAADLGTAFGLDMSFDAAVALDAAPQAPAPGQSASLVQRLAGGRKPTD